MSQAFVACTNKINDKTEAGKRHRAHKNKQQAVLQNSYLHKLHLQSPPFQFAIRDLKWPKLFTCLNSSGKLFHRTAAAYMKQFFTEFHRPVKYYHVD